MAYTAANDAFCAQADVEALVQRGALTAGSKPTAQQCLDWMARIAAEVEAKLAENGITYTVLGHGSPFPAGTPSDPKTARLKVMAESANTLGAAAMVLRMHEVKDQFGRQTIADGYMEQYAGLLVAIEEVAPTATSAVIFSDTNTEKLRFLSETEF